MSDKISHETTMTKRQLVDLINHLRGSRNAIGLLGDARTRIESVIDGNIQDPRDRAAITATLPLITFAEEIFLTEISEHPSSGGPFYDAGDIDGPKAALEGMLTKALKEAT